MIGQAYSVSEYFYRTDSECFLQSKGKCHLAGLARNL